MNYCAPGRGSDGSCFTIKALRNIATAYNRQYGGDKEIKNVTQLDKETLDNEIKIKLSNVCQNEWCWIDQDFIKHIRDKNTLNDIRNKTFRPKKPIGKYQWLSTKNIAQVMTQYQEIYPAFRFFGPVPIDFDVVSDELSKINLAGLYRRGIRLIAVVYNLDPHDKPGSHWVCSFINLETKELCYFDSYGMNPPKQIHNYLESLSHQTFGKKKSCVIKVNHHRHQYANSECGVYCIYFIVQSLQGKSFEEIVNNTITDKEMNDYRNVIFRPLSN